MGFFKKLFSKINPQEVFNKTVGFIDDWGFTKEERARASKEAYQAQLEFYKQTLNESSARSLTRRYIAIAVVLVYLFLVLVGVGMYPFIEGYSLFIFKVVGELTNCFLLVMGFYFGSSLLRTYKSKGKE